MDVSLGWGFPEELLAQHYWTLTVFLAHGRCLSGSVGKGPGQLGSLPALSIGCISPKGSVFHLSSSPGLSPGNLFTLQPQEPAGALPSPGSLLLGSYTPSAVAQKTRLDLGPRLLRAEQCPHARS